MRNRLDQARQAGNPMDSLLRNEPSDRSPNELSDNPLAMFGPERYEPRYEYPLVVWLHSCHSNERELESVMPALSMQNYVGCAPRGTHASEAYGRNFTWPQTKAATAVAEELVFAAIVNATRNFSIARNRIFLAGFGSGGTMALRLALRHPRQFAGVVSICGPFPSNHQPLCNLVQARRLPILWMYGEDSSQCGVEHICQTLPVLHAARIGATIRQYPAKDELLTNMLSDMNHWLMEQVTSQPASMENSVEESFSRN